MIKNQDPEGKLAPLQLKVSLSVLKKKQQQKSWIVHFTLNSGSYKIFIAIPDSKCWMDFGIPEIEFSRIWHLDCLTRSSL